MKFGDYLLAKETRPFPAADGSSFIKRRGSKGDTDSLSVKKIAGSMTNVSSEWFNGRLAHAGSFLGANVEEAEKMFILLGSAAQGPGGAKTGLSALSKALTGDGAHEVMGAAKLLNTSNEGVARKPQDMQQAAIRMFRFLKENERPVQKLACMSAKLLSFSMSGLEALAALSARDQWSDALHEQSDLHNAAVKNFIRDPHSDKTLVKAIAACYADLTTERERSVNGGSLFDDDEDAKHSRGAPHPKKKSVFEGHSDADDASAGEDAASDGDGLFGDGAGKAGAKTTAGSLFDAPQPRSGGDGARGADRAVAPEIIDEASRRGPNRGRGSPSAAKKNFDLPTDSEVGDDPPGQESDGAAMDAAIVDWGPARIQAACRVAQKPSAQPCSDLP